ncbi:hypothetical protein Cgig2_016643 [Carnegiea gigantea]|uniref:HD-Zip IV C-terminal domain-containing protein n=1 Tax=Carnegiea gigantea TaxID=171969 RepID=A0A9Q1KYH8_9CARY|nr:hypothetical protein Cgig2_016643 [Carnegiea gigantea]
MVTARHWMATLQSQCKRLVFFMASNVRTTDSSGTAPRAIMLVSVLLLSECFSCHHLNICAATLARRQSILSLAQRMTGSFCRVVGAFTVNSWTKFMTKTREDVRNSNDLGEPTGLILCDVSSLWLHVSSRTLFDFLRDGARCHEAVKSRESTIWVLQDSCTNTFESMARRHEQRKWGAADDSVTSSRNSAPAAKLSPEYVEIVSAPVSCQLRNIKTNCEIPGKRCFRINKMVSALSSKSSLFSKLTAKPHGDLASLLVIFRIQITMEASILSLRSRILCSDDKSIVERNCSGSKESSGKMKEALDARTT